MLLKFDGKHNEELVTKLNEIWDEYPKRFRSVLCALYDRDVELIWGDVEHFKFDDAADIEWVQDYMINRWKEMAGDYLTYIADDSDLFMILLYLGEIQYKESKLWRLKKWIAQMREEIEDGVREDGEQIDLNLAARCGFQMALDKVEGWIDMLNNPEGETPGKIFTFRFHAHSWTDISVRANSKEEAEEIAGDRYNAGMYEEQPFNFENTEVEEVTGRV